MFADVSMVEFVPLGKKLKRASTGKEDNFVPSYLPSNLPLDVDSAEQLEKVAELRWRNGIEVAGESCPPPVQKFTDLELPPHSNTKLQELGYNYPTPVQMQAIPSIMTGKDVIVLAETGSGKTLAYTIPLCRLLPLFIPVQPGEGPSVLIMAPTRELAQQIQNFCMKFVEGLSSVNTPQSAKSGYKTLLVCGGIPMKSLVKVLKNGVDVVVATPGRLLQLVDMGTVILSAVSYLVIDEADAFLQGSMEEDIRKVFSRVNASLHPRQTLLFSATLPANLDRLARSAVLNPITITMGAIGLTVANLEQKVDFMQSYQKPQKLLDTLRSTPTPPILVFCNSISTVDEITKLLWKEQFHVAGLHSEKPQSVRFQIMDALKSGGVDVLVSTDISSRGINVPDITHIINYDMPMTRETYIHRCGRTARWQHGGKATSFLTLDCTIASELKDLLSSTGQNIPAELENTQHFGRRVVQTELGDKVVN